VQSINFIAMMAEHVSREEKEKAEIQRRENERRATKENEKMPTLTQPALTPKFISIVPQLALEAFLPAIVSKEEKVKTTALNGVIKVVNSRDAAIAFMKTPGFELVLRQCACEIKNIRPIAAVAISKIFGAAQNPTLATEVCSLFLSHPSISEV